MKTKLHCFFIALALLTGIHPAAAQGTTNFFDGTFNDTNWTTVVWYQFGSVADATVTYGQQTNGGNPGSYRTNYYTQTPGDLNETLVEVFQVSPAFSFDPQARGAVQSFNFSIDRRASGDPWSAGIWPVVEQNGEYYFANPGAEWTASWSNFLFVNLKQSYFIGFYPDMSYAAPDFSAAGSPLTFGFMTELGYFNAQFFSYTSQYSFDVDNFQVVVNPPAAIVSLGGLSQPYNGTPRSVSVTTIPPGLAVNVTYNGSSGAPGDSGSYTVVATVNDVNYQGGVTNTLVIGPPAPLLSIAPASRFAFMTNTSGIFALASSPGVSSSPYTLVAADVNGDGYADLIYGNPNNKTLNVLTNNGSGVFGFNATYSVGNGYPSYGLTAADVSGDGHVDLISAGYGTSDFRSGSLSVLVNNGSGGFANTATLFPQLAYVHSVVAADVYGNGRQDLICSTSGNPDFNSYTLAVFANNGSGGFTLSGTGGTYNNSNEGFYSLAAFTNVDGRVDLAGANSSSGASTLTLFTNTGSGGGFPFVQAAILNASNSPIYVMAVDINGDGKIDLVDANYGGNSLTVFTNNGGGGFLASGTFGVGSQPSSVVAADVNGDGRPDLISANLGDNSLTVLTNNGGGRFVFAATLAVGINPGWVVAADVNHDGRMDLACANSGTNTLTVYTNTPAVVTNIIGGIAVSWPSPSTGFVLQQNSNLAAASWTNSSLFINDDGTNKSVTNSPSVGNLFFRLQQQ